MSEATRAGSGERDQQAAPAGSQQQAPPSAARQRVRPLLRTLLGEVLRRHRLAQRRTLADVARDARVSMPYLSELERGRKEASSEVLAAVCDALRIELSDLLTEAGRDLVRDRTPSLRLLAAGGRPGTLQARPGVSAPVRGPGGVVLLAA
jgi:transcriptional regulator with XRE-family HTH domain